MNILTDLPYPQLVLTLAIPLLHYASQKVTHALILNIGHLKGVPKRRSLQIYRYFKALLYLIWIIALLVIWGVSYQALWVIASSVLAVVGVALVAQWSILSNLTASIIVFFALPAKNGDLIEIIDGNNSVKGTIQEINFFNILLEDEKGNLIAYPNNLILQKPVRKQLATSKDSKNEFKKSFKNRLLKRT